MTTATHAAAQALATFARPADPSDAPSTRTSEWEAGWLAALSGTPPDWTASPAYFHGFRDALIARGAAL